MAVFCRYAESGELGVWVNCTVLPVLRLRFRLQFGHE